MGVLGIPLLENKKGVLGLGVRFSLLFVFVVWFVGFKNVLCFQTIVVTYYQMSISCFLVDIGPVSMIFKNCLRGSSPFFGARLFDICHFCGFLILLGILVSPKIKIVRFVLSGHVQKSWNHRNESFWVLQ